MSQGQHKVLDVFSSFWQGVIGTEQKAGNAALILGKLVELEVLREKYQQRVQETVVEQVFGKLSMDSAAIKKQLNSHGYLSNCTIDVCYFYQSLQGFDSTVPDTIEAFRQQLHHIIEQFIAPANMPDKDKLQDDIVQYTDNCINFYISLSSDDDSAIEKNIAILLEDTLYIIGIIAGLDAQQLVYIRSIIDRAITLLSIAKRHQPVPTNPRYKPSIKAQYDALKPALPEIETEIKKGSFPNGKKIKEVHLSELFEAGIDFTNMSQYDYQQTVLEQAKVKIANLLDVIKTNYDNPEILSVIEIAKINILHWLTLPRDFRPENWVEMVHFIVQNIQFSVQEYGNDMGIAHSVLPFMNKLERFLATVDNDDFKLVVAAKESPNIYEVELPDILALEEEEEEEDTLPISLHSVYEPIYQSVTSEAETQESGPTHDTSESQPLTLSVILEYLCFDEKYGALGRLNSDDTEIIYDLYYQSWLYNRIDAIIDDTLQLFSVDTLLAIWERIKIKTLDEKGVNLGELINFIIDEGVGLVNTVLDFIKKTIQYIIDEIFKLGKAIIQFFQNVNLPTVALELLKKLPPFANMPEGVTLLHVIAAIPYTLYQEFINFEYNPEVQPINAV
jgi:hypothetical protein